MKIFQILIKVFARTRKSRISVIRRYCVPNFDAFYDINFVFLSYDNIVSTNLTVRATTQNRNNLIIYSVFFYFLFFYKILLV